MELRPLGICLTNHGMKKYKFAIHFFIKFQKLGVLGFWGFGVLVGFRSRFNL